MTAEELRQYLAGLLRELPLDRYVERRFTALQDTGGIPVEMDFRFRGMLRDRDPSPRDSSDTEDLENVNAIRRG